jgi:hypothetical protein
LLLFQAKEILSQELLSQERRARRALLDKSEAEAKLQEECARAQCAREKLEEEVEALSKALEAAEEREETYRTSGLILFSPKVWLTAVRADSGKELTAEKSWQRKRERMWNRSVPSKPFECMGF